MHILVVEDDPRISEYLKESLSREGYTLDFCISISEVEAFMAVQRELSPQLVILDRMLGKFDGASLIGKIKFKWPQIGILVLSSLDMPSEKARIIDIGADEYLAKPFSLDELSARLRLIARRIAGNGAQCSSTVYAVGNLNVDLRSHNATVAGRKLDLTKKEFQLLCLLIESPGRVFNRFQILDRIWDIDRVTESNVVETTIKNIRRKMEDLNATARIESKRNIGYWIEA